MLSKKVNHILILNGWSMPSSVWEEFLKQDLKSCSVDVLSLDSLTSIADFNEQISKMSPPGTLIIGWSLGGEIALDFLTSDQVDASQKQNIIGAVFLQTTPCFLADVSWRGGVAKEDFSSLKSLVLENSVHDLIRRFTHLILLGSKYRKEDRKFLSERYSLGTLPNSEVLVYGLNLLESFDLREKVSSLDLPSLWVLGGQDSLIQVNLEEFQRLLPKQQKASIKVIEGMGHFPCARHSEEVRDQIFKFMDGL